MKRIAMLGSGFIGRFYADALQGQRSKDSIISIYSRREESAVKFAKDYGCEHWTTEMEASISHPLVDVVCISLPNNLHEEAVLLCCKHKALRMAPWGGYSGRRAGRPIRDPIVTGSGISKKPEEAVFSTSVVIAWKLPGTSSGKISNPSK